MKEIIPALLSNDIQEIKNNLAKLEGLVNWAQIDIMDNKFVPNISIAVKDLIDVKTNLKLEAHLMIFNPEKVFKDCENAQIKRVFFHFEAVDDVEYVLEQMREYNFEKGIAINPETPINKIKPYLDKIDLVLFLSVNPGFQGQGFIESVVDKIKELKNISPTAKIEIDGGINIENIKKVADAGVDYIVAGSAVLKGGDIEGNLKLLREEVVNMYENYERNGKKAWVRSDLRGKQKQYCMCWDCKKFKPNTEDKGCNIIKSVLSLANNNNIVLPVWECEVFEQNN